MNTSSTLKQRKAGFTLLELLVSMTITVIIVGMLTYAVTNSFSTLNRGTSNITSYQKSAQAFSMVKKDLEALLYQNVNTYQWLAAEAHNTGDTGNYGDVFSEDVSNSAVLDAQFTHIAFLSSGSDRYDGNTAKDGDVSCIEYGIGYKDVVDPIGGENPSFVLYRQIIDPNLTFEHISGSADLLEALNTSRGKAMDGREIDDLDHIKNIVCSNVKEFSVAFNVDYTPLNAVTNTIVKIPVIQTGVAAVDDAGAAVRFNLNGNGISITDRDNQPATTFPNYNEIVATGKVVSIEVTMLVLDDEAAKFVNQPAGSAAILEKVEQGTTRFTQTITIPQILN